MIRVLFHRKPSRFPRGAALVEFALVGTVFVLLVLTILDLSRYMTVKNLMVKGAEDGLRVAQKISFLDVDTRELNPTDQLYRLEEAARNEVSKQATRVPTQTLLAPPARTGGWAQLRGIRSPLDQNTIIDAIVLRPGESATYADGTGNPIDHPSLCAQWSAGCTNKIRDSDAWKNILRENPFVVSLRADFRPIVPGLPTMVIRADAMGYRELGTAASRCAANYDGDSSPDCNDDCPFDGNKTGPGVCGCGVPDLDSDSDGTFNCNDGCPNDANKIAPGLCGCGHTDVDMVLCSGSCYNPSLCPAQGGKVFSMSSCTCVCPVTKPTDCGGICYDTNSCTGGKLWDTPTCTCVCPATKPTDCGGICYDTNSCTGGKIWDTPTCTCVCPATKPTDCGGTCYDTNSCTDGKIWNTPTCTCVCPPAKPTDCGGKCYDTNSCTGGKVWNSTTCTCVCPATKPTDCNGTCYDTNSCTGGKIWNSLTCSCACPANKPTDCAGTCYDTNSCTGGKIWNSLTCSCACPANKPTDCAGTCYDTNSCTGGKIWNSASCSCACPANKPTDCGGTCYDTNACTGGKVWNSTTCTCVCPASKPTDCGGTCYDTNACTGGKVWNSTTCSCVCPAGKAECLGTCYNPCPANSTRSANCTQCNCNAGYTACSGSCLPNCPAGQFRDPAQGCTCQCSTPGQEKCGSGCYWPCQYGRDPWCNCNPPPCEPDCSCAWDTCPGQTCDDGCGGTCAGNKSCSDSSACCSPNTFSCCGQSYSCTADCPPSCGFWGSPPCSPDYPCEVNGCCSVCYACGACSCESCCYRYKYDPCHPFDGTGRNCFECDEYGHDNEWNVCVPGGC